MNVVESILFQCRYNAPGVAMCAPGTGINIISYGRLELALNNACRRLLGMGLPRGGVVGVYIQDPILHAIVALALARLGVVSFSGRAIGGFPAGIKVEALIGDDTISSDRVARSFVVDRSWIEGDGRPIDARFLDRGAPDDLCRIILTSGTTGEAKAVPLTNRLLADRVARHLSVFGPRLAPCSRIFSDMGLNTSLGYQFLIYTLWRGGTLIFAGSSFERTMEAFDDMKVECWVAAPAGLANLVRHYEQYPAQTTSLDLIISGGDVLPPQTSTRLRTRISPHLVSAYGSTEMSMTATAPLHAIEQVPGAVGYVAPGLTVEVINEGGQVLAPGQEGVVRIRSAFGVAGYLGDAAESGDGFHDGWFYPGDIGALTPEGVLRILGRSKTVLSVGGEKISPEMIEQVLLAAPGVEDAAAFTIENEFGISRMAAAVVSAGGADVAALQRHCTTYLPAHFVPTRFISVPAIARNAMGKIDRPALRRLASQGGVG